ncbi:MAG: hypothetical protein R6U00_09070 [Prochlorococcaceae cyanobacterium]
MQLLCGRLTALASDLEGVRLEAQPLTQKHSLLAAPVPTPGEPQGGSVIDCRHVSTVRDSADHVDPTMGLQVCAPQTTFSKARNKAGIQEAWYIDAAFRRRDIPVALIITSECCRAWQTAELLFGRPERKDSRL